MARWQKFYKNNKLMVWSAGVAVILAVVVLIAVKDEVTRFTLIMPIFAGFILFSILTTPDEELEDMPKTEEKEAKKAAPKRSLRRK